MRMNLWANFVAVVLIQTMFFVYLAKREKNAGEARIGRVLIALVLGVVFGVVIDLFLGAYVGIFGYHLGTTPVFLFLNGAFSYGVMIATVFLLRKKSFIHFYGWTIALGLVYEAANFFFPLWFWTFSKNALYTEVVLIFAAYCGLSMMMAVFLRVFTGTSFRFLQLNTR
jgi:hypothetical protein